MATGKAPQHLIVALHGYASTGRAMAAVFAQCVSPKSGVDVFAPDGPHRPEFASHGRAWYPITSQLTAIERRAQEVAPAVRQWIARERQRRGVPAHRTCLVGFSQGVAVAAAVLTANPPCDRAVLVCGRLPPGDARPPSGKDTPASAIRPPGVLVIGGGLDRFVPYGTVRNDTANSPLRNHARFMVLPGLDHSFTSEVARLVVAHTTTDWSSR